MSLGACFCLAEAIKLLPLANTPEVFGLHANAEIGYYTQAVRDMWSHLLELQPQTGEFSLSGCVNEKREVAGASVSQPASGCTLHGDGGIMGAQREGLAREQVTACPREAAAAEREALNTRRGVSSQSSPRELTAGKGEPVQI